MTKINNKNELTIKILYWGPGGAGKARILESLHESANNEDFVTPTGELIKIKNGGSTTYFTKMRLENSLEFFSELKLEGNELDEKMFGKDFLSNSKFSNVFFALYSVGGNPAYLKQRKKNFSGADGIVMVFDSVKSHWIDNVESLRELKEIANSSLIKRIPLIIMLNKIDLTDRISKSEVELFLKEE